MVASALILALAAGGVAYASAQFKQQAKITLTAKKQGASTGFNASLSSSDPGAPNGQPQGLKTLTVVFPQQTRFNFRSKAMKQCGATDTEVKATGGAACPSGSLIGRGSATANGAPVFPQIPEKVTAYASANEVVRLLLAPSGPSGQTLVIRAKVKANTLTASVPKITAGGLNIVITQLALQVKAIGKNKNAFVTAGKCTNKKFVVSSKFLYQTGAKLTIKSSSGCSK